MCQLLGMNCNVPTDICFSFAGFRKRGGATDHHRDGWGIAFFEGRGARVFLDATQIRDHDVASSFPTAHRACREHGFDLARQPIPISPAAHYHMGGIAVDLNGRTSLPGLWAVGEAACTGAHGANRLASNSLLEAVVFGRRVGRGLFHRHLGGGGFGGGVGRCGHCRGGGGGWGWWGARSQRSTWLTERSS